MSEGKIRVIVKRPDEKYGHVTYMSNTLKAYKTAVGGHIETVRITNGCVAVVNEEGKIMGLEPNFKMGIFPCWDQIVGTAVIVGTKGEDFTDCPLDFSFWKILLRTWGNDV